MVQDGLTEANRLNLTLRVMFQDEARFGRINDPKRCWCRKGFRPTVGKQIVREYTYAYGAFSPKDGIADFLIPDPSLEKNPPTKIPLTRVQKSSCKTLDL